MLHPTISNKLKYTTYKKVLTSCLRKAEENYFQELITSERQNLYKLWSVFGSIINPNKLKKDISIRELIINNIAVNDNQQIANSINDHFSTVGDKLAVNTTSED